MSFVYLNPVSRADAPALIASNLQNQDFHKPWVSPFIDQAGFDLWFNRTVTGPNVGLVARASENDAIVGVVNLSEVVMGAFQSAYLGYYGTAAHARRGWMREALTMAVAYAFERVGLHRLEANIQPGNAASIALVRQLGFAKEGFSPAYLRIDGIWQDHERWALRNE